MKDKKKKKNKKQWNKDDCDFDSAGRFVIKNPELARRLASAVNGDSGLVLHISTPANTEGLPEHNCLLPVIGCIITNKRGCVDDECGDWILRVIAPEAFRQGFDEQAQLEEGGG